MSCKKTHYEISKYSNELNEKFINFIYPEKIQPNESLTLRNFNKMYGLHDEIIYVDFSNDLKDYYTCGYLDKKIIKMFNNKNNYISDEVGKFNNESIFLIVIENSLVKYNNMVNWSGKLDYTNNQLVWYEIPKNKKIPRSIKNKILVCILESKTIFYRRNDNTIKYESEYFIENQLLYSNYGKNYEYKGIKYYNELIVKNKYMLLEKDFYLGEKIQLPFYKNSLSSSYMKIVTLEKIDYVNVEKADEEINNPFKKVYDYKIIEDDNDERLLFKLNDVLKIIDKDKINLLKSTINKVFEYDLEIGEMLYFKFNAKVTSKFHLDFSSEKETEFILFDENHNIMSDLDNTNSKEFQLNDGQLYYLYVRFVSSDDYGNIITKILNKFYME